jgi:acetyltransferase EpsM
VIINAGAVVDHDAEVCDFVHLGPGAVVASLCKIGKGAFIGAGAVVPSKSVVPAGTVLAPGATFQPLT